MLILHFGHNFLKYFSYEVIEYIIFQRKNMKNILRTEELLDLALSLIPKRSKKCPFIHPA